MFWGKWLFDILYENGWKIEAQSWDARVGRISINIFTAFFT